MNYCPSCGTANRDGSRFCNECGTKMPSKTGIVCPMCSHINSTGNVYCDNCQARLVPATAAPEEDAPVSSDTAPDPAVIGRGLSLPTKTPEDDEEQVTDVPAEITEDDDTPDWLHRLREAAPKASERRSDSGRLTKASDVEREATESNASDEIPDWMRPGTGELTDWFDRLSEATAPSTPQGAEPAAPLPKQEVTESPPEETEFEQGEVEEDQSAWMNRLQQHTAAPDEAGADAGEVPDWVSGADADSEATREEDAAIPDWLTQPEDEPQTQPVSIEDSLRSSVREPAEDDSPDWLTETEGQTQEPASSEEVPSWLADFDSGSATESQMEAPPVETEAPPVEDMDGETPDWLSRLRDEPATETPAADAPAAEEQSEELPDWLGELDTAPTSDVPFVEPPISEDVSEELPDWLNEIGVTSETETEEEPASSTTEAIEEASDDTPDWLSGTDIAAQDPPATEAAPVEDTSDWLKELSPSQETVEAPAVAEEPAVESEVPDWLSDLGPAQEVVVEDDSLAEVTTASTTSDFVGEEVESLEAEETVDQPAPDVGAALEAEPAEVPEWLNELGPMRGDQPAETPFEEVAPAEPGDVPDWLTGIKPGAEGEVADQSPSQPLEQPSDTDLAAAAIPGWLEAMRPSETDGLEVAQDGVVESTGVLAGLKDVLPQSEMMAQTPGESAVMQAHVPGADMARAGLLQKLLAGGAVTPTTVVRQGLGQRSRMHDVIRWIIALVFILLTVLPQLEGSEEITRNLFNLGDVSNSPFIDAQNQIEQLKAGDVTLVAFDYDAFQAGEMDVIAEAFITHIGMVDAEVWAVSLNPAGPALANRVLENVPVDVSSVNLGYFPGQAVGVQSALTQLSQAKLIVVLSSSPESVRWWIEQAALLDTAPPLVAGLSAGALPQVLPYLHSGQVRAEVTGAMAALAYQRDLAGGQDDGSIGLERTIYSEMLYLLQLAFVAFLIIGAIISLLIRPRQTN